ncbi:MAG: class I SAM-dependent methyltransferase [Nitrospirota bacterium]
MVSPKLKFSYDRLDKEEIACPLCGGNKFDLLASKDRYGMGIPTTQCLGCGMVMTNPRPTEEAMAQFYQHYYRQYYVQVETPTPQYIKASGLEPRASYTVDFFRDHNLLVEGSKVLDVGCGAGFILKEIGGRYPNIIPIGVEPGLGFSQFARQNVPCEIVPCMEEVQQQEFHLIFSIHVLEHTANPVQFLINLKRFLSPQGRLFIDVPDATCYRSIADLHIAHLFHFSLSSLLATARLAQMRVILMERHNPPYHPKSIRCIMAREGPETSLRGEESDNTSIAQNIRSINRMPVGRFQKIIFSMGARLFGLRR